MADGWIGCENSCSVLLHSTTRPDLVISLYQQGAGLQLANQNPNNIVPYSLYKSFGSSVGSSNYFVLSGTSMAAPMVTGAVALMLQKNSALTPDQIKARLMKTAYKGMVKSATVSDSTSGKSYLVQSDIFTVGAGVLDIQAALSNADLVASTAGSALSPLAKINSAGNIVATPNGSSVLGGSSILWGSSTLWGSSSLSGVDIQGNSILWGTTSLLADSILWGSSTVNSDSILWGASILWGSNSGTPDASTASLGDE